MNSDSNINTSTNTFGKYVICKYLHPYFVFVLKIQILTCQAWNDIIKHCNVTKNALNLTISLKTNFIFVDFSKKKKKNHGSKFLFKFNRKGRRKEKQSSNEGRKLA